MYGHGYYSSTHIEYTINLALQIFFFPEYVVTPTRLIYDYKYTPFF